MFVNTDEHDSHQLDDDKQKQYLNRLAIFQGQFLVA
jgi:hypothetical protein